MEFDPYHVWLGIPPSQQPPDHYQLLGVASFEEDGNVIQNAADQRMMYVRSFQNGEHAVTSQQLLNEISKAKVCLLNQETKSAYDDRLRSSNSVEVSDTPDVDPVVISPAVASVQRVDKSRVQSRAWLGIGLLVSASAIATIVFLSSGNKKTEEAKPDAGKSESQRVTSVAPAPRGKKETQRKPTPTANKQDTKIGERGPEQKKPDSTTSEKVATQPKPEQGIAASPEPPISDPTANQPKEDPVKEIDSASKSEESSTHPDLDAVAESLASLKTLFGEDYQKARKKTGVALRRAELTRLASRILESAAMATSGSAEHYAHLHLARDIGIEAGHVATVFSAIDQMSSEYKLDSLVEKQNALSKWKDSVMPKALRLELVELTQGVADEAVSQQRFEVAVELLKLAKANASKALATQKAASITERIERYQRLKQRFEAGRAALLKVKAAPNDPEANLIAGRFICFDLGDWPKGLPLLARGGDQPLAKLAADELKNPSTPQAQRDLAQRWWKLADEMRETEHVRDRAVKWYETALPDLPTSERDEVSELLTKHQFRPALLPGEVRTLSRQQVKFCWCPPGSFQMGAPKQQVRVTLTGGFWMSQTEVTQDLWQRVMNSKPWVGRPRSIKEGPNYPAAHVTWEEAKSFCSLLTLRERKAKRIPNGWSYAIPTEGQWEYACRAGTTSLYSFRNDSASLGEYAWVGKRNTRGASPTLVAGRKPNPWGLFDMHGNVWEWCDDWHHPTLKGGRNPRATTPARHRVYKGGGFLRGHEHCYSHSRGGNTPDFRGVSLGFRFIIERAR